LKAVISTVKISCRLLISVCAALLLAGCNNALQPVPTTAQLFPEPTALPTSTVAPTATSTPAPTATSTPPATPTPVRVTPLDGSQIALVVRTFSPPENYGSNVVVLSESQGAVQEMLVDDAESPSWSSDGRQLLLAAKGAIALVDISTWQPRTVSFPAPRESDHWPQWSPDGQWISFVRAAGPKTSSFVYPGMWQELSLWTMQTDGSRLRRMAPAWQPDGSSMTPAWSPDSTTLAYPASRSDGSLEWRFVEAASGRPITMALAADDTLLADRQLEGQQIVWAPRSAAGIIVFDWENGRCAYAVSLSFFDAHSGHITRVWNVPRSALLRWSVDGSELRFDAPANYEQEPGACNTITPEPPRTFAVPRDGGPIRSLALEGMPTPTAGGAPTVRIDTRGVQFVALGGTEHSVMQFTPEVNLLNAFCRFCAPAIVPSAHRARILFVEGRLEPQGVHGAVWSVDNSTGGLKRLTTDQDILDFAAYP
jgi:hypothetical protein